MTETLAKALPVDVATDLALAQHHTGPSVVRATDERAWTPHAHRENLNSFEGKPKERPPTAGEGRGIQKKAAVATKGGRFLIKPYYEKHDRYHQFPTSGWAEMTNQHLYHEAGVGHLHQQVHVEHAEDFGGGKHPYIAIKVAPGHKTVMEHQEDAQKAGARATYHPDVAADVRKIAALDFLGHNTDHHDENIMIGPEGRPLVIDNGNAMQYRTGSSFRKLSDFHVGGALNQISRYDPQGIEAPDRYADTMAWWREKAPAVKKAMEGRLSLITDPAVRAHIEGNFNARHQHLTDAAERGDVDSFVTGMVPTRRFDDPPKDDATGRTRLTTKERALLDDLE